MRTTMRWAGTAALLAGAASACGGADARPVAASGGSIEGDWRATGCANLSSGHPVPFECVGPADMSRVWVVIRLHAGTCEWGSWDDGQRPSYERCSVHDGRFCWSRVSTPGEMCAPMKAAGGRLYRCLGDTLCEQYDRVPLATSDQLVPLPRPTPQR